MEKSIKPRKPAQAFEDGKPTVNITMTKVDSTKIHSVGYDADTHTLAVRFNSFGDGGGSQFPLYHYPGVAPEFYDAFKNAESMGKFFGANVQPLPFKKYQMDESEVTTIHPEPVVPSSTPII